MNPGAIMSIPALTYTPHPGKFSKSIMVHAGKVMVSLIIPHESRSGSALTYEAILYLPNHEGMSIHRTRAKEEAKVREWIEGQWAAWCTLAGFVS